MIQVRLSSSFSLSAVFRGEEECLRTTPKEAIFNRAEKRSHLSLENSRFHFQMKECHFIMRQFMILPITLVEVNSLTLLDHSRFSLMPSYHLEVL